MQFPKPHHRLLGLLEGKSRETCLDQDQNAPKQSERTEMPFLTALHRSRKVHDGLWVSSANERDKPDIESHGSRL